MPRRWKNAVRTIANNLRPPMLNDRAQLVARSHVRYKRTPLASPKPQPRRDFAAATADQAAQYNEAVRRMTGDEQDRERRNLGYKCCSVGRGHDDSDRVIRALQLGDNRAEGGERRRPGLTNWRGFCGHDRCGKGAGGERLGATFAGFRH